MTLPQGFRILAESTNYILGNAYEYGYIFDKRMGQEFYIGDSYGDPQFGLIDKNENWAMLFGHDSYLWTPAEVFPLSGYGEMFEWPYEARQASDLEVEILDDPWSDDCGIYLFNIGTRTVTRIRDFKKLEIPYDVHNQLKIDW